MPRTSGFSIIEGLLIIVALVIIGAIGYLAYSNFIKLDSAESASTTSSSSKSVKVENKADLETAAINLDSLSLDDTDSSQLDSATNSF